MNNSKVFTADSLSVGMVLLRSGAPVQGSSLERTNVLQLGYCPTGPLRYGLTSVLTDGCFVGVANSLSEVADHLNNDQLGYRRLTKQEYLKLVMLSNFGWQDSPKTKEEVIQAMRAAKTTKEQLELVQATEGLYLVQDSGWYWLEYKGEKLENSAGEQFTNCSDMNLLLRMAGL